MAEKINTTKKNLSEKPKKKSLGKENWDRFRKNPGAMIGLAVVIILILIAVFADVIVDYDTDVIGQNIPNKFQKPNSKNWLGTDELGRDILARLIYGSRFSLAVGFVAVIIALIAGVTLGSIAGYYGGVVEEVIMRGTDIFSAIPNMLMAIVVVSALGPNTFNLMIAVGVASIPQFVRITRASVLTVKNQEYIEASRAMGLSDAKIIASHIIPNCMSPIIVQTTLRVASAIISASALSFLGLGVPAPAPEWGSMLSSGRKFMRKHGYLTVFPGLAIMITVLSLNLLGDGLRDVLDPKLKK